MDLTGNEDKLLLTKQMRIATREIHNLSDALVNSKLVFALNNNDVWADGLLVFYEVFKFLEENVPETILPRDYYRAEAFEADLTFYKGDGWEKTYKPRPSVQNYLKHLKNIQEDNPTLLIAYVYHLYMGMLSGGQILHKKRQMANKLNIFSSKTSEEDEENIGANVTTFSKSISTLKTNLRHRIDEFTSDFDLELRQQLIEESKKVFELNNEVIRTVEGVLKQNLKLLGFLIIFILSIYVFLKMWLV